MATVAQTKNVVLTNVPFLIRKISLTGGTTSATITHGEDRAPDITFGTVETESATVTTVIVVPVDATTFKVDCLGDAADTIQVYCVWLSQASGGLSTITTT